MKLKYYAGVAVALLSISMITTAPAHASSEPVGGNAGAATGEVSTQETPDDEERVGEGEAEGDTEVEPGAVIEADQPVSGVEFWSGDVTELTEQQQTELADAGVNLSLPVDATPEIEIPETLLADAGVDCVVPLGEDIVDGLQECASSAGAPGVNASMSLRSAGSAIEEPVDDESDDEGDDGSAVEDEEDVPPLSGMSGTVDPTQPQISRCLRKNWEPIYSSRTMACFGTTLQQTVVDARTGQVVGGYLLELITTSTTRTSGGMEITDSTSLRSSFHTGVAAGKPVKIQGTLTCVSVQCSTKSGTFSGSTNGQWTTAKGLSVLNFPEERNKAREITEIWDFRLGVTDLPARVSGFSLHPRCDNASVGGMGAGCVFPQYTPTVNIAPRGTTAAAGKHIQKAVASGLPTVLNRASTSVKRSNRNKVCPSSLVRQAGYECDEYPFASTKQGGQTPRVLEGCGWAQIKGDGAAGTSRCQIIAGENKAAGNVVSTFYVRNRILVGDKFGVSAL